MFINGPTGPFSESDQRKLAASLEATKQYFYSEVGKRPGIVPASPLVYSLRTPGALEAITNDGVFGLNRMEDILRSEWPALFGDGSDTVIVFYQGIYHPAATWKPNGGSVIMYGKPFSTDLDEKQTMFVLAHEMVHTLGVPHNGEDRHDLMYAGDEQWAVFDDRQVVFDIHKIGYYDTVRNSPFMD